MVKILIADDHPVARWGVKQILAQGFSQALFGEAQDAREVLKLVQDKNWDLLVLDISLPDRTGLEVLDELKKVGPKLPVLFLSMYPENQFAVRALKSGASGYIVKDSAPGELVKAARKVLSGGKYVSPPLAEKLASDLGRDDQKPLHERLSNREYQVMRMIASGKTASEIGRKLNLSIKTISTYRARLLEKMGMRTNAQLTCYAVKNELVD